MEAEAGVRYAAVTGVQTCALPISNQQDYSACTPSGTGGSATIDGSATGLPIGTGASSGNVEVTAASKTGYTIVGHSKSGNDFTIVKNADGSSSRRCTTPATGGCPTGGK